MVSLIIELDKIHKPLTMHAARVNAAVVSDLISRWKLAVIIAVIVPIFFDMSLLRYLQLSAKSLKFPQLSFETSATGFSWDFSLWFWGDLALRTPDPAHQAKGCISNKLKFSVCSNWLTFSCNFPSSEMIFYRHVFFFSCGQFLLLNNLFSFSLIWTLVSTEAKLTSESIRACFPRTSEFNLWIH